MKFTYLSLRNGLLCALGSVAFAACGGGTDSGTTSGSSVDAAYGALVSDIAHCGKQVDSCLNAAADSAAVDQCRAQFSSCRDSAGAKAENSLAGAVTSCTSKHRECAKAAHGGDAGVKPCTDDLKMCLASAHGHDGSSDDADGGVDESSDKGGSGKNKDCLEDLRSCVEADGKPADCAHEVRSCIVAAMPSVDVVAPKRSDDGKSKDAGAGEDHSGKGGDSGKAADAGKPEDAGSSGKDRSGEARKCVTTFSSCVEAGGAPQTCLSALKDCKSIVEP